MAAIRYDRDALIAIGLQSTCQLTPDPCWPAEIQRGPNERHRRKTHRGKRAGVRKWLKYRVGLPTILLSDMQSLDSSLQELQVREKFQKDIQNCNLLCFTETRLNPAVPDHEIQFTEFFSLHRMDTAEPERFWGGGLCFMVNRKWCDSENVAPVARYYSHNLKLLSIRCRPMHLSQDFPSLLLSAVSIPPQANADGALLELHRALTQQQVQHPDAALIVAGDFSGANLRRVMPDLHQHIASCKGLHCYTSFADAYKSQSYSPYGKCVHAATFFMPIRAQEVAPVHSEVTPWLGQSVSVLQHAVDAAEWEMMLRSYAGCWFQEPFDLLRI